MGKPWHDAGRMAKKMNTFTDFIAAGEYLVAEKIAAKDRLAIEGGSAGGLLMGAVVNMRPDLFSAVIAHVPFVDVLNTMSDATLPLTVGEYEEWGNPAKKDEYDVIRTYCPYTNLKKGAYPGDARQDVVQRQPGLLPRAREVRRAPAHAEDGLEPAAPEDEHGRGARRRLGALRLPPRDRARPGVPPDAARRGEKAAARASKFRRILAGGTREGRRSGRAATIAGIAAILAVFVLVRLPLLTVDAAPRGWNGDSAIFGLMAKKIHDGRGIDVFFWGQTYMGPLTPALAAGIRKAFLDRAGLGDASGPISLRLASMAQIAFGIAVTVLAFTRLFGRTVAVATGIWMAFGPPFFVSLSAMHRNELGPEMAFALGSLLLYLAADALTRPRPVLDRPGGRFVFGLLAGFGWWMNQTIVFVLLPAGVLVLARAWRSGVRRLAAPVLAGAALGYFPVWMGRLLRWYEPADGLILLPWRLGQFPAHFVRFVWSDFWKITGLEGLAPPLVLVAAAAALAAVLVTALRRRPGPSPEAMRRPPGAFALVVAVAGLGAGVYVMAGVGAFQLRYLTSALPAFLALILLALGEAAELLRRRVPSAAVTFALAALAAGV